MSGGARQVWDARRRRATFSVALILFASVWLPSVLVFWLLGGIAVFSGLIPAFLAGITGLVAASGIYVVRLRQRITCLYAAPLSDDAILARDALSGRNPDTSVIPEFWLKQQSKAGGDRWIAAMILAVTFSTGLNTVQIWGGPAATLAGVPYYRFVAVNRPLVRLTAVGVIDPVSGEQRRYDGSDGYLQVNEGAQVFWQLAPSEPATSVAMHIAGGASIRQTIVDDQVLEFAAIVTGSMTYRFSLYRWGTEYREQTPRRIEVIPDLAPEVVWEKRPPDRLDGGGLIEFAWRAIDDRAVSRVELEIEGESDVVRIDLYSGGTSRTAGPDKALVDSSELPKGAEVTLTILAADNDRYPSPNIGRSEPIVVRVRSIEERHEEWEQSLQALLQLGVRLLGDTLDQAPSGERWQRHENVRTLDAFELARRARELGDEARSLPLASVGAADSMIAIARYFERIGTNREQIPELVAAAEEGVFEIDELIGREAAARLEFEEDQLVSRLESLEENLDTATDAELLRMMKALERELQDLAGAMREKRPQLPTELVHRDAFRSEEQEKRQGTFDELRDAMARGDTDTARERIRELIDKIRESKEALAEGAQEWHSSRSGSGSGTDIRQRRQEINDLRNEQESLAEQMESTEQALAESSNRLREQLQSMKKGSGQEKGTGPGGSGSGGVDDLLDTLGKGDMDAAREQLSNLSQGEQQALASELARQQKLRKEIESMGGGQRRLQDRVSELAEQMETDGFGSAKAMDALDQASRKMGLAGESLADESPGEGANHGWQAADELKQAEAALEQLEQQQAMMSEQPGFGQKRRPGDGEGSGEGFRQEEYELPERQDQADGGRKDVLQGFRGGIPDAGRDVNERYLDRLLH